MNKLEKIKMIIFDVDGVLTDGTVLCERYKLIKRFHVRDGKGFQLAKLAGLMLCIMSADYGVMREVDKQKMDGIYMGTKNKLKGIKEVMEKFKLKTEEIAYVGDDYNDIPALEIVGLPIAVIDAVEEVKELVHSKGGFITELEGGKGVAREVIKKILTAKGEWKKTIEKDVRRQKNEDRI